MNPEELRALHKEFSSLHRQFKNKLNQLKAIIEQAEEQKPKDEPLTVDPIKQWAKVQVFKSSDLAERKANLSELAISSWGPE